MEVTIISHVHSAECFIPKISAHVLGDFNNLGHGIISTFLNFAKFHLYSINTFSLLVQLFFFLKNDASFPQEITRTSQTYRRQNQSACPVCCAFLSRRARLTWHEQKMCAVTIVGTVRNFPFVYCT